MKNISAKLVFFAIGYLPIKILGQGVDLNLPVGSDTVIIAPTGFIIYSQPCQSGSDTCIWKYFYNSPKPSNSPFFDLLPSGVKIIPDTAGFFADTLRSSFKSYMEIGTCSDVRVCDTPDIPKTFLINLTTFYDDKIKIIGDNVYFSYDSVSKKYRDASASLELFNNKSDSVIFSNWKIIKDSSQSVALISLLKDSLLVSQISILGYDFSKNVLLNFKTSLAPSFSLRNFSGIIQMRANFSGKDSICIIPLTFNFDSGPKSSVDFIEKNDNFSIHPNPSSGLIQLSCTLQNPSILHLHIFDELGRDVMAVFDGMMNDRNRDFSSHLPPGIYYARMGTGEGVVTKKVVVE